MIQVWRLCAPFCCGSASGRAGTMTQCWASILSRCLGAPYPSTASSRRPTRWPKSPGERGMAGASMTPSHRSQSGRSPRNTTRLRGDAGDELRRSAANAPASSHVVTRTADRMRITTIVKASQDRAPNRSNRSEIIVVSPSLSCASQEGVQAAVLPADCREADASGGSRQ